MPCLFPGSRKPQSSLGNSPSSMLVGVAESCSLSRASEITSVSQQAACLRPGLHRHQPSLPHLQAEGAPPWSIPRGAPAASSRGVWSSISRNLLSSHPEGGSRERSSLLRLTRLTFYPSPDDARTGQLRGPSPACG